MSELAHSQIKKEKKKNNPKTLLYKKLPSIHVALKEMRIFNVPEFGFVYCVSDSLQIHLAKSCMNKKNYWPMHYKDNLPSMKLLSADRSTDSNYCCLAISRTSLYAGIIQSLTYL